MGRQSASPCSSWLGYCLLGLLIHSELVFSFQSPPVNTNPSRNIKITSSPSSSSWISSTSNSKAKKSKQNRDFVDSRLGLVNQKSDDNGVFSAFKLSDLGLRKSNIRSMNSNKNSKNHKNDKNMGSNRKKKDTNTSVRQTTSSLASTGNSDINDDDNDGAIERLLGEWNNDGFWKGVVVAICLVWSTNFAVVKDIFDDVPDMDPSLYCALRFTIAGIVCLPNALSNLKNSDLFIRSSYIGLSVFLGYIGQTNGMQGGSTADKCAFICSLNVVWVAAVASIRDKNFRPETWVAAALAISGVAFLELAGTGELEVNDLWLLLQPLGFGSGYLFLEDVIKDYPKDAAAITSFKLIAITICSCIWAFVYDGNTFDDVAAVADSNIAVAGILYTGLVTTAAAIWVQSLAFKRVSAKDVSMILTTEPIWAAIFSSFLIGEVFTPIDGIGAFLILSGCFVNDQDFAELFPTWFSPKEAEVPVLESKKK